MIGLSGLALPLVPSAAWAQSQTFGTDRNACDRSAMSQVLSTSQGNVLGSAAGAAVGGLLGNQVGKGGGQTLATIAGVVGGALAGGYVGRSMEPADQGCVGQALEHTPTNQTVAWQNPDNNTGYWVTPTRTYRADNGEQCRDFVTQAAIGGQRHDINNTACRQPDGSWRTVASSEDRGAPPGSRSRYDGADDPRYGDSSPPRGNEQSSFQRYSDRQLREQLDRLDDQERRLQGERHAVQSELDRRGVRY
jgi:surface antigen